MKEILIDGSISSITSKLQKKAECFKATWFRGQPDYDDVLLPSIFRQGRQFEVVYNEAKMFEEFKRRYHNQSNTHKNTYEWLTLMQHYGLPTRLLDWSSNLLVALYFCCVKNKEKDGAIFVLDPTHLERDFHFSEMMEIQIKTESRSDFFQKIIYGLPEIIDSESLLNGHKIGDLKKDIILKSKFTGLSTGSTENFESLALKQDLPNTIDLQGNPVKCIHQDIRRVFSNIIPFRAPHLNPRIRQQHGYFTFHGGMFIDGEEFIAVEKMEKHPYLEDKLIKIKIHAKDKKNLLRELEYTGIREASLFPEMEYQAKEIRTLFSKQYSSEH